MAMQPADFLRSAREAIKEVSPAEAKALIENGIQVLDVRDPNEFATNAPIAAINVSRGMLEFKIGSLDELSDRNQPLLVICGTGARSAMAAQTLGQMGFTDVSSMAGGLTEWGKL